MVIRGVGDILFVLKRLSHTGIGRGRADLPFRLRRRQSPRES